jgi:hypothetical protein
LFFCFVLFVLCSFVFVRFPSLPFASQPHLAVSCMSDAIRSNIRPKPKWRRIFYALNSALDSDAVNARAQKGGNASPAVNEISAGTRTKARSVAMKARASMHINSESISNEIDESDLQYEKHDEQRI